MTHNLAATALAALTLAGGHAAAGTLNIIYQASAKIEGPGAGTLLGVQPVSGGAIVEEQTTTGQAIILLSQPAKGKPWVRTVIRSLPSSGACSTGIYNLTGHLVLNGKIVWGMTGATCGSAGGVFELTPPATPTGRWTYRSVFLMPAAFATSKVGSGFDDIVFDSGGNLYGLLRKGGYGSGCDSDGCGRFFEVTAGALASGKPTVATLYTLPTTASYPEGLVRDRYGHLFTSIYEGGPNGLGSVWEVSLAKTGWTGQDIHDFCAGSCADGGGPVDSLSVDASGNLYGTSKYYGAEARSGTFCVQSGDGVFWKLSPPTGKSVAWSIKTLYTLYGSTFTGYPCGSPTSDAGVSGPEYKTLLTNTGLVLSPMDHAHATGGGILSLSLAKQTDAVYAAFGDDEGGPNVTAGPEQLAGNLALDSSGNVWGVSNSYINPAAPNDTAPPVVFEITP